MSSAALAGKPRKRFTPEEYLLLERSALEKSEYYDGEIFAMAGALEAHNIVAANALATLLPLLRSRGCQTFGSDMKVGVTPQGPFFYPDVMVACGARKFLNGPRDTLLNPTIVVEVLSKSTQRFDRAIKVKEYQRIASVNAVLLISADHASVEVHTRSGRAWQQQNVTGLEKFVEIASPRCILPLAEIYQGVDLRPQPKAIQ